MAEKQKWYRSPIIPEAIFIVAIFLLTMVQQWIEINTFIGFLKGLVFFLIIYVQAYLHRVLVFPLLTNRKYWQYGIITIITLFIGATLLYIADRYWISPEYYDHGNYIGQILYLFVITATSIISIMALFIARQYQTEIYKRSQDQVLLNEMQIKLLHAQLNPHFFFNMLNNVYGVSLTTPDRTPDLLLKLSRLMRYQLETASNTTVSLEDEINFISNYIVLEKERVGKRCDVTFTHPDSSGQHAHYTIAPLILITLVENAFKHSLTITNKWFVDIDIALIDATLKLTVINSLADQSLKSESTGLGLQAVRKRLELLYHGRYTFESGETGGVYKTQLTLELSSIGKVIRI